MFKTLYVLCIVAVVNCFNPAFDIIGDQIFRELGKNSAECIAKTNVNPNLIEQLIKEVQFPNDGALKCFIECNSNLNKGTEILTKHKVMDYITFTNIVGPETIKKFEALHDIVPKDAYEDFLNLYKIWNWFGNRSNSLEQNTPGTEEIQILEKPQVRFPDRENINNDVIEHELNKTDQNIQNNSRIHIIANVIVNLPSDNLQLSSDDENNSTNGRSLNLDQDSNDCLSSIQRITNSPVVTTQLIEQNHILRPTLVKSPFIGDYLTLPEPPQRKEKKIELEKERDKAEKKREQIRIGRETKCKQQNTGNEAKCHICGKLIRISKKMISCEDCKYLFHKTCIPRQHRIHIPNDDDNDNFLCHDCYREESDGESDIEMDSPDVEYDKDKNETKNVIDHVSIINSNSKYKSNADKFNQENDEEANTDGTNHEIDSEEEINLLCETYKREIKKLGF
ncbi:hypothetical protein RN001_011942 [Aquatica leii]|uniref:PHD-type domain-containing protein n=1 Tax=Aquatica leii TaxID=1421715 RepID=A0AAN7SPA5_9COLE|nr:hypothetical protein RN001_011942 [Aquatica leii]